MADKKISALTAASTPLAGTEVLPIVQSGATVKVAVSDLTAGRAVSATQLTLTTGNLIVSDGKGVDFSATSGTGTSELFADYEEGTWEAAFSTTGGSVTINSSIKTGTYTKIGRVVTVTGQFEISAVSSPTGVIFLTGLPFTCAAGKSGQTAVALYVGLASIVTGQVIAVIQGGDSKILIQLQNAADGLIYNIASSFNASTVVAVNASYSV
jgi:hypothetical protein